MSALTRTLIGASALPVLIITIVAALPRTERDHVFPTREAWLWKTGEASFTRIPLPHPVTNANLVGLRDGTAVLGDLRWNGGGFAATAPGAAAPPKAPPAPGEAWRDPIWLGGDRWFTIEWRGQDVPVRSAVATNGAWSDGPTLVLHDWADRAARTDDGTLVVDQYGVMSIARPNDAAFHPLTLSGDARGQTLSARDNRVYTVNTEFRLIVAHRIDLATGNVVSASATPHELPVESRSSSAPVADGLLVAINVVDDAYDRKWLVPNVAGALALPAEILFLVRFLRRRPDQPDRRPYFFIGVAIGGAALFGFGIWIMVQIAQGLSHM